MLSFLLAEQIGKLLLMLLLGFLLVKAGLLAAWTVVSIVSMPLLVGLYQMLQGMGSSCAAPLRGI